MRATVSAATLVLCASALSAQAKTDFSGKWAVDAEKTAAANPQAAGGGGSGRGGRGGMGAGPITITSDANTLTVIRETQQGALTTSYKLDGSEQTITMPQGEAKAKAKWDGSTVVIETTTQTPNGERKSSAVYSLEGEWLVIATTQPARGGGENVTTKRYYKKQA